MNPYLLTISFLMLMSLITSSEVSHFVASTTESHLYHTYLANCSKKEAAWSRALMDDFREKKTFKTRVREKIHNISNTENHSKSVTHPDSLGFDFERPPNNGRLNLYLLLHKKPSPKEPQGFSLYELTAQLMRRLYGEEPFFQAMARAEYRILDALIETKEESKNFVYPDELSSISFQNNSLQQIFYQMLKGTETTPSLLNFLTFDKEGSIFMRRINLMFVSPIILEIIFPQEQIRAEILSTRAQLWEEIIDQETHRLERTKEESKNRTDFKNELTHAFEATLMKAGLNVERYKQLFDFSLGKRGNILFITDSETQLVKREKYQAPQKNHPKTTIKDAIEKVG